MKQIGIIIISLAIASGVVLIWGCSDDSTGSSAKPAGDSSDIFYMGAWVGFDFAEDIFRESITNLVDLSLFAVQRCMLDATPGTVGYRIPPDGDSIYYDNSTKYWHYRYSAFSHFGTTLEFDSVQFRHGRFIVQWPHWDSLTSVVGGAYRLKIESFDRSHDTVYNVGLNITMDGNGRTWSLSDAIKIEGTGNLMCYKRYSQFKSGVVNSSRGWFDVTLNNAMTPFPYDYVTDLCPSTGKYSMHGLIEQHIDLDQGYHDTRNWQMTGQFAGDDIYYLIKDSKFRWEDTVICSPN
jgi:hypothetical protein